MQKSDILNIEQEFNLLHQILIANKNLKQRFKSAFKYT